MPAVSRNGLWQTLNVTFFQQWLSSSHSSTKARFVECANNYCLVNRLCHLSCESPQLLQNKDSYHLLLRCVKVALQLFKALFVFICSNVVEHPVEWVQILS
ncbi:hypothetical protein ILYODFUR_012847 [Ilyodon furcidens]|uniref:Uncharacterized protein n=1 Tax=Ilyodon furcidens TaxID=33524 RepID=A0ABV0TJ85_9TELE